MGTNRRSVYMLGLLLCPVLIGPGFNSTHLDNIEAHNVLCRTPFHLELNKNKVIHYGTFKLGEASLLPRHIDNFISRRKDGPSHGFFMIE